MPKSLARINVLGSCYSVISFRKTCELLLAHAQARLPGYVCVSNVHTTMMGFRNPEYRQITNASLLSVPDGQPIRWAMRALGAEGQERVRGPSLMREICDQGRAHGFKHFLYGGSENTLQQLRKALMQEYPGIAIVGVLSPPFRPLSEAESKEHVALINQSGAHFLWVGLGAPKQEEWMWRQRDQVKPIMLGVGAAFDLLSGRISEAPILLQRLSLEWLYRLLLEPRRLWRRYLWNNPAFLGLFIYQWLSELLKSSNPKKL